ncbi:MAG: redoxin domain-containing protein [Saprospiraceae bacterium]|nr:redoxin domain-containing protein [Saprospiraceae bacterium]
MILGIRKFIFFTCCLTCFTQSLFSKDSITVYIFLLDECRICQEISPEINQVYQNYKHKFGFLGVFPNFSSKQKGIDKFVKKYNIKFNTTTDYFKRITNKYKATILPEVVVYNEDKNTILYRGAINDLFFAPGKRKHDIQNHYLMDALSQIDKGQNIVLKETQAIGCFINFTDLINN